MTAPNIFTIHGTIGAGKSTILKMLREDNSITDWVEELGDDFTMLNPNTIQVDDVKIPLRGKYFDIVYNDLFGITALFPEPSDEWKAELDKFYANGRDNTAEFQLCVLASQSRQIDEIKAIADVVDTIFIERTAWDAKNIFVQININKLTAEETKHINNECDKLINRLIGCGNVYPFHVVTTENDVIKRVALRGLVEKAKIDLNPTLIPYLKKVRDQYMEKAKDLPRIVNASNKEKLRRQIYRSMLYACGRHPLKIQN